MGDRLLTRAAFAGIERAVASEGAGKATFVGEQRHRKGLGLDELVDPKGFGVIRRSITRMEQSGDHFKATVGLAMLVETLLDTTGSMGGNVDFAFKALPDLYDLLADPDRGVLSRYDVQIITSIFGDKSDEYVLCRSQAEMAEKIAEQMTLMVPEREGGDSDEDPHYGLFGAAYLTWSAARKFGLKSYHFTVTDARGRDNVSPDILKRVFGPEVFDKAQENGYQVRKNSPLKTEEVVNDLLETTHAFVLQIENSSLTSDFWKSLYGKERVIALPETRLLPYVQAALIGLTEGNLDLQNLEEFLIAGNVSKENAKNIKRAVAKIPLGAQAQLKNFDRIPVKGTLFAQKGDVFPIGFEEGTETVVSEEPVPKKGPGKKDKVEWL